MENFINNAPFIVVLLCLIVGFVFLVKGADLFVEGSSSVAKRFKVPSLIIGLTIVAMGTSLPETAVSVAASIAHNNTLAVSNVTGSNIFNLMVVIGVCALMTPVVVDGASLKRDFPFSMICAILLLVIVNKGSSILQGYQSLRILAWLKPEEYPETAYQQQNSIMAIGSGQFFGKGLYNNSVDSVKNGNYISEPHTDFIFSVAGEEMGFLGSVLIILLLLFIVYECIQTAKVAKDLSGKLICSGMAALVGFQSFVNICVVTGLFPNTGLPLPFVSYGLTSLVTMYFGMGFVLNVGLQAKKY